LQTAILVIFSLHLCFSAGAKQPLLPPAGRLVFYGDTLFLGAPNLVHVPVSRPLNERSLLRYYEQIGASGIEPVVNALRRYREVRNPDDWMYYQLVRKIAGVISPKSEDYISYTLYKWYLLLQSGYDVALSTYGDTVLFYVHCEENIFDIPYFTSDNRQYVCLNFHDYGFNQELCQLRFDRINIKVTGATAPFSYRLTALPEFPEETYREKELQFEFRNVTYRFKVKINEEIRDLFTNYPVADYQLYFDLPFSRGTYESLIPQFRRYLKGMSTRKGVEYLMRFTRYAFLYQSDQLSFGREKRLLPEQTLAFDQSDCEDRAALFFCLVKEIYNLPMIVLAYPDHVTVAVSLEKGAGKPIFYKGQKYYVCEPTPQAIDLRPGEIAASLEGQAYEIAFAYTPSAPKLK